MIWSDEPVDLFWVDPALVVGYSREQTREQNIHASSDSDFDLMEVAPDGSNEIPSTLIADYLKGCLIQRSLFQGRNGAWPARLNASTREVFDAAIFLMEVLYSYCPVTRFASGPYAIDQNIAEHVAQTLKKSYFNSQSHILDEALRGYSLDTFEISPLSVNRTPRFKEFISQDSIQFLDRVYLEPKKTK